MALLDRLKGTEEPRIPAHQFYAALVALADGQITRTQLENLWSIASTGQDKAQLDVMVNGFQAAADKGRYLTAVHAVFMLLEENTFDLTQAQISTWLSAAESAY